ncbi:MAG: acyl-CoA desaturase [Gemmatimonadales bacterium]
MATTTPAVRTQTLDDHDDDIVYPDTIPFLLVHLACFAAIWTGVTTEAVIVCLALYVIRMFGNTAGYHRYFSHRSFKTSRVGQFLFAWLAQSSAQKGILWWAAKHRHHHRYSDTELDVHSPVQRGFWYSHVGWIFTPRHQRADYSTIPDLTRYPELVWLNRHKYLPPTVLALVLFLTMGWSGLVVGFFWSTTILYHGTFTINSLAHVHGKKRYVTGDDSRNNWWLAIITLGEGWHNNHHAYQRSTRQGFRWYEIDITYYVLTVMSWFGLVWDLTGPPPEVVANEHRLGRAVIERVAQQLARHFPVEQIGQRLRETWAQTPTLAELRTRASSTREELVAALKQVHLPQLPSVDELRHRAQEMYARTPSLDEIAHRAREILMEGLATQLLAEPA